MNGSGNSHYEMIFKNGRSLFTIAEIKASSKYRDMEDTFGIVPIPKYDEEQEQYYSHRTHICLVMSVPVTNQRPEDTGKIMDTFSYLSYTDILPIFYNEKVAQKGLRNEESIEMLGIIAETRSFDIGEAYAWTEELSGAVNTSVVNQKNTSRRWSSPIVRRLRRASKRRSNLWRVDRTRPVSEISGNRRFGQSCHYIQTRFGQSRRF